MLRKHITITIIMGILLTLNPQISTNTHAAACSKPATMMITLDISDSMKHNDFPPYIDRQDAAKKITTTFVNKIDFNQDKIGLMFFAENPTLAAPIGSTKATIISKIQGYDNQDGTRIYAALTAAYAALPSSSATTRYIIMPTDGKHYDNPPETDDERDAKTIAAATTIKKAGVIIVTLGIADGDSDLLDKVATPGYSFFATSASQMETFFDTIADRVICTVSTSTPNPSKSPSPSPTPPLSACEKTGNCSQKQIGDYALNVFSNKPTLIPGSTNWIKLLVEGRNDYNDGTLIVHEKVNPYYFELVSPKSNIKIYTRTGSSSLKHITDSVCAAGSCVANVTTDTMDISIPNIKASDEILIYFPVKTIATSDTNIDVDNSSSELRYPQLSTPIPLDNTQVKIPNAFSYFQTFGGDIYSDADTTNSIKSALPKDKFFTGNADQIVLYKGDSANFGNGEVNNKNWQQGNYTIAPGIDYNSLYNEFKSHIIGVNIAGTDSFMNISDDTIYIEHTSLGNKNLVVGGNGWDNKTIKGKNIVIFVPGDLFITRSGGTSYIVSSDGQSSISFIVAGRIGIDPGVSKIEGIFIADGVIDTACTIPADTICSPSITTSTPNSTLNLEGYFISSDAKNQGGFNLDRKGIPNTMPGEDFKARPDFYLATMQGLGKVQLYWKETI
ncbi:MAG: VWA domain-containing protein [bacterium]|nr:VWA domain-containing protein [bacterium]